MAKSLVKPLVDPRKLRAKILVHAVQYATLLCGSLAPLFLICGVKYCSVFGHTDQDRAVGEVEGWIFHCVRGHLHQAGSERNAE